MTPRILVVDDEEHIRDVIVYSLRRDGFEVDTAADGSEALDRLARGYDLIVLDILLPELDGLAVCREVRARAATPIIFVSSRAEEVDRILGLELGGDDYVVKPFSPRELVARVKTVLRRTAPPAATQNGSAALVFGPLVIDPSRHEAHIGDEPIAFTATEFAILVALLSERGRVLSRDDLVERIYTATTHVTLRTMDTHVRRIRSKLRRHGVSPIETVHGVGYRAAAAP